MIRTKKTYTEEQIEQLSQEIRDLKEKKNAFILAHYYQELHIQDVADLVGDSLGLSKAARDVKDADMIVFAGVFFMAETAKILNPDMKVVIPNLKAGCPLADKCDPDVVAAAREKHPNAPVIVYINTTAETKAVADLTCTSSNAAQVVKKLGAKKVLFGPDRNLGKYVQKQVPDVEIIPVPENGYCIVHKRFDLETIDKIKQDYPDAILISHPEANIEIQEASEFVGSTAKLLKYGEKTDAKTIIVATEKGLVDLMSRKYPDKKIILAKDTAICRNMKKINLENLRDSLKYNQHEVIIPEDIRQKAEKAIVRMLELS
ncbi:MAG: quinolinate synthase NadA [Asgard group archaeon]|nr:quinolinate synthase NadA [Asgard group archaeon]